MYQAIFKLSDTILTKISVVVEWHEAGVFYGGKDKKETRLQTGNRWPRREREPGR